MRFIAPAAVLFAALIAAAEAPADEIHKLGDIVIEQPWSRATPVKTGGAYMTLRNNGDAADKLVKIASPDAERVEIHETKVEGGMAMMRPVAGIELKRRASVQLKPGGLHVMLMGLRRPLKEGEHIKLVLTFERAGTIEIEARVEKAGAMSPGDHRH